MRCLLNGASQHLLNSTEDGRKILYLYSKVFNAGV